MGIPEAAARYRRGRACSRAAAMSWTWPGSAGPVQALRLSGQHVDGFVDVAVGGRAGDAVVGGEPAGPARRTSAARGAPGPAGELPAAGRGAAAAALGGEQPGQVPKQFRGHVERGTIGDQVESWWRKGSVVRPLLLGLHGCLQACPDCLRACLERTSRMVKDQVPDPLSARSPHSNLTLVDHHQVN